MVHEPHVGYDPEVLTDSKLEREPWQDMTPEERLRAALRLWQSAWDLKMAWVRQLHPQWSDEQVLKEVRDAFLFRPG